ncbi:GtrA family protein [Demequina sp. NBRC 110056]|uniref:GtrA family protein n=1 Tax=Demequina sp. NBRC 110056 TaxID=1570345 RepID=UPI000A01CB11|nr:GtrA family protein [Demequina sp. NBRC 110056]
MDALATPRIEPAGLLGLLSRYRRFLLYVLIGGGAVVIDVGLYALLAGPAGWHPLVANTTSTFLGMAFSFTANSLLNFKVTDRIVARFLSFMLVGGVGFVVSTLMLAVLIDGFGVDALVAKAATLPVVLLLQFTLNKRVTFATPRERTAA